jgi:antitoxin CcdA
MKIAATSLPSPKRPFNLTLNESTVEQARCYTTNLSATVDSLLAEFVAKQAKMDRDRQQACDAICAAWNDYRAAHGSFADEHCRL